MINGKRLQEIAIFSLAVMILQIVVSKYIYPVFGTTTQNLYSITPTTAVASPTLGNKLIGYLSGIIPLNLGSWQSWIAIYIGVFLVLVAGYGVYSQTKILGVKVWKGRNMTQRIWAILLYGSITFYLILLVTKISAVANLGIPLAIGVAINYAVIAIAISMLAKVRAFSFLRI